MGSGLLPQDLLCLALLSPSLYIFFVDVTINISSVKSESTRYFFQGLDQQEKFKCLNEIQFVFQEDFYSLVKHQMLDKVL